MSAIPLPVAPRETTSAEGPIHGRVGQSEARVEAPFERVRRLFEITTSGVAPEFTLNWDGPLWRQPVGVGIGLPGMAHALGPRQAIAELRRLSGLTWEQLAELFGVNRRSLHFWASGQAMAAHNEQHLQRLLMVLRRIDRGFASANRSLLLSSHQGAIAFDLLKARRYEDVINLHGESHVSRAPPRPLTALARAERAPQPPAELVGTLEGRVPYERPAPRPGKSVRMRSKR